jgi:hypothetical protein
VDCAISETVFMRLPVNVICNPWTPPQGRYNGVWCASQALAS